MPPRRPIDPAFVRATRRLARRGLHDAEIVRQLQPLTVRLGKPVPSYHAVRRIAALERARQLDPYVDELLTKLAQGRMPDFYGVDSLLATQSALRPGAARRGASPARRSGR